MPKTVQAACTHGMFRDESRHASCAQRLASGVVLKAKKGSSHFFECDQLLRHRFSNEGYLCAIDLLLRTSCFRLLCTSVSFVFLMTLSSPVWSPTPTSRMFQFFSVKTQRSGGWVAALIT